MNASTDNDICRKCIKSIFLVCGGNDTENLYRDRSSPFKVVSDYESLLDILGEVYPNAVVNVISLIPRRIKYSNHLEQMVIVNNILSRVCNDRSGCKFIDIFTYFLKDKKKYILDNTFTLNEKLYGKDNLHFSHIGNSILGKVIIGVTYNPR